MAVVYYMQVPDPKMCTEMYEHWENIIPEGEISATAGTKEYYRSLTAHMLARSVLMNKYLIFDGMNGPKVKIDKEESGRPYFVFPKGFHVSLTHGGQLAACAVSTTTPVGLDVQAIDKIPARVYERLFTENEREYVGTDPVRFAEIWTRKESFVKMTGTGITHDIDKIDTVTGDNTDSAVFTTKRIGKKFLTLCTKEPVEAEFVEW